MWALGVYPVWSSLVLYLSGPIGSTCASNRQRPRIRVTCERQESLGCPGCVCDILGKKSRVTSQSSPSWLLFSLPISIHGGGQTHLENKKGGIHVLCPGSHENLQSTSPQGPYSKAPMCPQNGQGNWSEHSSFLAVVGNKNKHWLKPSWGNKVALHDLEGIARSRRIKKNS